MSVCGRSERLRAQCVCVCVCVWASAEADKHTNEHKRQGRSQRIVDCTVIRRLYSGAPENEPMCRVCVQHVSNTICVCVCGCICVAVFVFVCVLLSGSASIDRSVVTSRSMFKLVHHLDG
jgi:hypothetical protein